MADLPPRLTEALKDRYSLIRELGAGGMATVYLAEDPRNRRQVAIKVLRPDLAATLGPERFLREVTIAANLQHPHILPVYDSGEGGGFLYYVMPYVEGESLRDRLAQRGELPLPDAVRVLRDVADALAAAHAAGVVHRDIKPENILLSGRHALVADFGVAKAVSEASGRQTLTTAGVALGTPTYMAPEQAAADPHADHRADIYAFGVMAYEVLTGQPPFVGATPQAVMAAHVTQAPTGVTERRATIPPSLAQLVMQCLEKKPADRPQDADGMVTVLEGLATPSGGITPTQTQPVGSVRPAGSNRRKLLAGAVVVLVLGALGVFALRSPGATEGGTIAVFPFVTRSADSADVWLAEGLSEQIGSRLTERPQLRVLSVNAIASQQRATPDPLEAGRALGARWVVTGTLRRDGRDIQARVEVAVASSGVQEWSSSYTRQDGNFATLEQEVSDAVARTLLGRSGTTGLADGSAHVPDPEAYRLFLIGNALLNRRTPETSMQAVASYEEAVTRDPAFAAGWAALGNARVTQHSWGWTVDVPRDSLAALARRAAARAMALDSLSPTVLDLVGSVATWIDGDFVTARRVLARAVELDSMDALLWHSYGSLLGSFRANDLPAAERALRRSLALDPDQPNTWRHLARAVGWAGRFAAAEAIADTMVALGPWPPAFFERAYYRYLRGDGAGALADLARVEELTGSMDSLALAVIRVATGDRALALAVLQRPRLGIPSRARLNMALGRPDAALTALEGLEPGLGSWVLLHDPVFLPLKEDPRFVRLMERVRPEGV